MKCRDHAVLALLHGSCRLGTVAAARRPQVPLPVTDQDVDMGAWGAWIEQRPGCAFILRIENSLSMRAREHLVLRIEGKNTDVNVFEKRIERRPAFAIVGGAVQLC